MIFISSSHIFTLFENLFHTAIWGIVFFWQHLRLHLVTLPMPNAECHHSIGVGIKAPFWGCWCSLLSLSKTPVTSDTKGKLGRGFENLSVAQNGGHRKTRVANCDEENKARKLEMPTFWWENGEDLGSWPTLARPTMSGFKAENHQWLPKGGCLWMSIRLARLWSFPKSWGYPQIIHVYSLCNRMVHYKPSSYWGSPILGNLCLVLYGSNMLSQYASMHPYIHGCTSRHSRSGSRRFSASSSPHCWDVLLGYEGAKRVPFWKLTRWTAPVGVPLQDMATERSSGLGWSQNLGYPQFLADRWFGTFFFHILGIGIPTD